MCEMFSPERVTEVCKQYGLTPGQAMDIKNGCDFDLAVDRKNAWASILQDKPKLVIGSPPCTFVSRLQELNKHTYRKFAMMLHGWFVSRITSSKLRDMFGVAFKYTSISGTKGDISCMNIHGWRQVGSCRRLLKSWSSMTYSE